MSKSTTPFNNQNPQINFKRKLRTFQRFNGSFNITLYFTVKVFVFVCVFVLLTSMVLQRIHMCSVHVYMLTFPLTWTGKWSHTFGLHCMQVKNTCKKYVFRLKMLATKRHKPKKELTVSRIQDGQFKGALTQLLGMVQMHMLVWFNLFRLLWKLSTKLCCGPIKIMC